MTAANTDRDNPKRASLITTPAALGKDTKGTYPYDPACGPAFETDMCTPLGRRKLLTSSRYARSYGRMSFVG